MAQTPPCPVVEKAMIDHLTTVFPGKVPVNEQSAWQIGCLAGEQRVVEHLMAAWRQQEKTNVRQ